jgi:peptide/nickel transport system substrate-binding protein
MKRALIVFLAAISMVVLPIIASAASEQPQRGGEFKILVTRPATSFGYPPTITGPNIDYAPPFFDRLMAIDENGDTQPELALSWDTSADGKTITIKLRKDVQFHDNTPFNAQAVKANLDKLIPPNPVILDGVTSVDVIDDYTVKLNLVSYNNLILYQLAASENCYMYSPTALQKNGPDWAATHPVGTGPFMLKEIEPNISVTMVKNPNYWQKGLPYLDGIKISSVMNPMTQMMTFQAKQANAIYDAVPTTAAQLRDAGYKLVIGPGSAYTLSFDSKNSEIFKTVKVRQAIEYAIDKEAITSGPGLGLYMPIYQLVNSKSPDYNKSCPPRKYDPAMAKKLLAEAGYPNGFSFKGYFQDNTWKDGVVAVQSYLEKVGIKMEINYVNSAAYSQIRTYGKLEKGAATNAPLVARGNNLFMLDLYFRSDSAIYQYMARPAGSDALIEKAKASRNAADTTKLNQQIIKLLYDDETVVPLWHTPRIVVLDKSVRDAGWFINDDPTNNKFGFRTWLKKE